MIPVRSARQTDQHLYQPHRIQIRLALLIMSTTSIGCVSPTNEPVAASTALLPQPTKTIFKATANTEVAKTDPAQRRQAPRRNAERIETEMAERIHDLETRYSGRIQMLPIGNESQQSGYVMFELMREWNPLFATKEDLLRIIGPPRTIDNTNAPDRVIFLYTFDSGRAAKGWEFTLKHDRVIALRVR